MASNDAESKTAKTAVLMIHGAFNPAVWLQLFLKQLFGRAMDDLFKAMDDHGRPWTIRVQSLMK